MCLLSYLRFCFRIFKGWLYKLIFKGYISIIYTCNSNLFLIKILGYLYKSTSCTLSGKGILKKLNEYKVTLIFPLPDSFLYALVYCSVCVFSIALFVCTCEFLCSHGQFLLEYFSVKEPCIFISLTVNAGKLEVYGILAAGL